MIRQRSLARRDRSSEDRTDLSHADDAGQYSENQLKPSCTALDDSSSGLKTKSWQRAHTVKWCWFPSPLLLNLEMPGKHLNMFMHGRAVCLELCKPTVARPANAISVFHGPCVP